MKLKLEKDHWFIPELTKNLRNSAQVFDMVESIKCSDVNNKMAVKDSLGSKIMGLTINATLPKLIPIDHDERDKVIPDAIMFAMRKTKDENKTKNPSFVIMHDNFFKTEDIS